MDDKTRTEIEAAAFRGLVEHLQRRTDVQNIDLMNLAGFCRNCLSKWYMGAAEKRGLDMSYDSARERVYGMTYGEWKDKYQREATPEQLQRFEDTKPMHASSAGTKSPDVRKVVVSRPGGHDRLRRASCRPVAGARRGADRRICHRRQLRGLCYPYGTLCVREPVYGISDNPRIRSGGRGRRNRAWGR